MSDKLHIKKVAVLGAGVMGAQIAAHFSNAGFDVLLFDLPSKKAPLSSIAEKAIQQLQKMKPSPLALASLSSTIQPKNYEEHLLALNECDLIIEAVAERLDIKKSVYDTVAPHIHEHALFVTNTSGLSINVLAQLLPSALQPRFCGVHFFNPPRYMHLLELIPSEHSSKKLIDTLETFFVSFMGKGVVRAKDTPNFIANRVGVFSMLATIHHAKEFNIPFHIVDALTGLFLGRPKSATFRTMDVVGLDTMMHVINTMQKGLSTCPWHKYYEHPKWLTTLVEKGSLGQKTSAGIYKKEGKNIKVFEIESETYIDQAGEVESEVLAMMKLPNLSQRLLKCQQSSSKQAQFIWACFRDLFHYCAHHLEDISNTTRDIDLAIRWGFGWQEGPFETWQAMGFDTVKSLLCADVQNNKSMGTSPLPSWVNDIAAFYKKEGAFNPSTHSYQLRSSLPVYEKQLTFDSVLNESFNKGETLLETEAVRLWTLDGHIAILSFKSKANCIGSDVLEGMLAAIDFSEKNYSGLVIWQQSTSNFSVGANLKQFVKTFTKEKIGELKSAVYQFQRVALRLKYCSIPTIAAIRGRALGGGCEFLMQCDDVVASIESYVGLVEIGVGLLPAGGGLKELALRAVNPVTGKPSYELLENAFKTVAMGQVSTSALEAKALQFLKPTAQVILNTHEVLFFAIQRAKFLAMNYYLPPVPAKIPAQGIEAMARLKMIVVNMAKGGFISEHDAKIANQIATVICGGALNEGEAVDEEWFLRLEINAFVELAQTSKTKDRVTHLLETGKPLRN